MISFIPIPIPIPIIGIGIGIGYIGIADYRSNPSRVDRAVLYIFAKAHFTNHKMYMQNIYSKINDVRLRAIQSRNAKLTIANTTV